MSYRQTWAIALLALTPAAYALDTARPDVSGFIDMMVDSHEYDRKQLEEILGDAQIKDSILEAISRPAEKTKEWYEYRSIFLTDERIRLGADFWREHDAALTRISEQTGVSKEILVGIIGVETKFGRITGKFRVVDALSTLAFEYPPRSRFFRRELEKFLLLIREEGMQAADATGSYAGAMGRPQFMPSSYLAYAVDATGDGHRDIWNDWDDVIGSIANYFVEHGWKSGDEVVARATLPGNWAGELPQNSLKPRSTVAELSQQGILFATDLPGDQKAQLLTLQGESDPEYWVGFHNFFVITRYNTSVMYALAVHQLGQEIALTVRQSGD